MTVQGLGTAVWRLNGRAKMTGEFRLRSARRRVRGILMQWHGRLGLPPASNQEFRKYLEKEQQVTPDAAPFSGESHWWTPEILSPVLGGSAATAAARPQDAPRATLGTPAWALNPHTRCAAAPRSALLPEFRRPRRGRRGRRRPSVRRGPTTALGPASGRCRGRGGQQPRRRNTRCRRRRIHGRRRSRHGC